VALHSRAIGGLRSQGRLALLARSLSAQVWCALHLIDLGVAIPAAEEGVRLARETSQPNIEALGRAHQALIAALRGDQDGVERNAAEAEREGLPVGARPTLAVVQWARGLSALGEGRHADAYEHLRRVHDRADPAYHISHRWSTVGDVVEAAVRSGQRSAIEQLMAELEQVARRTPAPMLHIGLRYARALAADDADAEALYQTALSADLAGWPFARARTQLAYGEWLRRQRRAAESRGHLRAARETFDALGIGPWGDKARHELRASGETSRRRSTEPRDLLTAQELQIAQLAADGFTNREIGQKLYLSHRTVSTHLHRIFPKVGVTSRGALRAVLHPPA
jgi:DNA-binding NarL/FixJ family response regulator